MDMQYFLEKIVGSEDRKEAVVSILEGLGVSYRLQKLEFEHEYETGLSARGVFGEAMIGYELDWSELQEMRDAMADDLYEMLADHYDDLNEMCGEGEENNDEGIETWVEVLTNIIVDIGDFEHAEKKVIVSAHHDVVDGSCGANDNGAAIAILLKLIVENRGGCMRIVFFDGEETGGRGSRGYIEEYVSHEDVENTILVNLDVCGCGDLIVSVDNSGPFGLGMFGDVQVPGFPFSDASIFNWEGIPTYSLSVFPKDDIRECGGGSGVVTGAELWKYMHCGSKDDIKYIDYGIMGRVYETLVRILSSLGAGLM